MTEEKKIYLQHAFRYGSIAGFISFVYYLIGFYSGFEKNSFIFDNLYFFISMAVIVAMMVTYRKQNADKKIKFSRFFTLGFVAIVIVSLFMTAYTIIRVLVLDPFLIVNVMELTQQSLKSYGFADMSNPNMLPVVKSAYIFASFLTSVFNNTIYILLISAFMVLNNKIYTNTPKQ